MGLELKSSSVFFKVAAVGWSGASNRGRWAQPTLWDGRNYDDYETNILRTLV
jgi:hypothetical protein